jgi:orotate phosphoribosyltransferase
MSARLGREFARFLAQSQAVKFGSFKLKSGKTSNVFFDFGSICSGHEIGELGRFFAEAIVENSLHRVDAIFGPAYKGINIAIATSIALWQRHGIDVPFAYNRKVAKDHGEGGLLVGFDLAKAKKVLVVDDVITDGLTKYETINLLSRFPGLEIACFLVGVDRQDVDDAGQPLLRRFVDSSGLDVRAITTRAEVLEYRGLAGASATAAAAR